MTFLNEDDVELNALDEFRNVGWETKFGPDISKGCADETQRERDEFDQLLLEGRLRAALHQLNPEASPAHLDEAVLALTRAESQNVMAENLRVYRLLVNGCPIEYRDDTGQTRGLRISTSITSTLSGTTSLL